MSTADSEQKREEKPVVDPNRGSEIFMAALDFPSGPDRLAYLDRCCGDDVALRKRVEQLLAAAGMEDSFLEDGAAMLDDPLLQEELPAEPLPEAIGPYRIDRELGQGGFGQVYLGYDEVLKRPVAIKVPHPRFLHSPQTDPSELTENEQKRRQRNFQKLADEYLDEARKLATLEHPHIVTVYSCGSTERFPCYIVSQLIDGMSLETRIKESRFTPDQSAELIATIAEALHHAHQRGLYHRDIKPANLFLDKEGKPYVGDFGLALRDEDFGTGHHRAGTPPYMSPELARGEGHRVDGRSDIFSLSVIFYELLVGKRPFRGDSTPAILEQVKHHDPRPPRQYDDRIPAELERICLKGLAKKATERYTIAKDMAQDLRLFLKLPDTSQIFPVLRNGYGSAPPTPEYSVSPDRSAGLNRVTPDSPRPGTPNPSPAELRLPKIVPKGLRSFDAHDADFFLELVPGPRDRDGLPESLRFWKARIETTVADQTFQVGLIDGPSGCGKSSLMKAGLLPRLSSHVIAIYVESTAEQTEARLLSQLRNRCPTLPKNLGLVDTLTSLRKGLYLPANKKVLLVLDQFEQWLHVHHQLEQTALLQGLRQCDGAYLQSLLMVRVDFSLQAKRFLQELEIRLVEGVNYQMVDLFGLDHAKKVLRAFGQAYSKVPEGSGDADTASALFIHQSVVGLAEAGKVISVRLSLFADMLSQRDWTLSELAKVGGVEGVGVAFLEEKLGGAHVSAQLRGHQQGARSVLRSLLPETGTEIKGQMQPYEQLRLISGYGDRRQEFAELMLILDRDLRLITPTDPSGMTGKEEVETNSEADHPRAGLKVSDQYYQLSHDYLVPSLRDWLTRKQRETRRGRAELRLAERAAIWREKPETRHLPSVWETLSVWWFVPSRKQTAIQQQMMRKAKRVHVARWGSGLIALMLIGFGVWAGLATLRANNLKTQVKATVDLLPSSRGLAIPLILRDLARFPQGYVTSQLNERYANAPAEGKQSLAYALAEFGRADIDYLCNSIEAAFADEVDNLVHGLANNRVATFNQFKRLNDTATAAENWQLKARLAIIALKLGEETFAAEMCQIADRPDPIQRTIFINVLGEWHGELAPITHYFKGECGPALRSGLMLGIGTMAASSLPNAELAEITTDIKQLYVTASESIVHSAAGWILRQWKEVEPTLTGVDQPAVDRDWFVNQQQMTMVKIESGHFVRQTLPYFVLQRITKSKNVVKRVETVSIKKSFYLSDREVTVGQFEAFRRDCMVAERVEGNPFMSVAAKMMQDRSDFLIQKGLQDYNHLGEGHKLQGLNIPVVNVSWEDSIVFCNWLSQQHGGKPCYLKIGDKEWEMDLSADGYRLPTDAEWEYACRAGTTTEYSFGSDSQHLKKYAVLQTDSPLPGGSARPNGWGLFDMNGNVWEWRHEIFGDTLVECAFAVFPAESRIYGVFRGGSYNDSKAFCRSESTRKDRLDFRRDVLGFRVVFVSSSE